MWKLCFSSSDYLGQFRTSDRGLYDEGEGKGKCCTDDFGCRYSVTVCIFIWDLIMCAELMVKKNKPDGQVDNVLYINLSSNVIICMSRTISLKDIYWPHL